MRLPFLLLCVADVRRVALPLAPLHGAPSFLSVRVAVAGKRTRADGAAGDAGDAGVDDTPAPKRARHRSPSPSVLTARALTFDAADVLPSSPSLSRADAFVGTPPASSDAATLSLSSSVSPPPPSALESIAPEASQLL